MEFSLKGTDLTNSSINQHVKSYLNVVKGVTCTGDLVLSHSVIDTLSEQQAYSAFEILYHEFTDDDCCRPSLDGCLTYSFFLLTLLERGASELSVMEETFLPYR